MKILPYVLILVLIGIIFLQRACVKPTPSSPIIKKEIKIDTVYSVHTDTVPKYIPVPKIIIKHDSLTTPKPSKDTQELRSQFVELEGKYYGKTIYNDTLKLDTIGYVSLKDTISQNLLIGRSYTAKYTLPVITKETIITEKAPVKRQLYIGGEIVAQKQTLLQGAYVGILYKNKKDQIFGVKGGMDIQGQPLIGVSSYWKIKLHK